MPTLRSEHQRKLPFQMLRNASQSENSTKEDRFHPGEKIYVFDNYVNQFCLTIFLSNNTAVFGIHRELALSLSDTKTSDAQDPYIILLNICL